MPKSANQKLKLLYIMKYLNDFSDEYHPVTLAELTEELLKHGISAERKSIYDDLEALRTFGMDVATYKGRGSGYFWDNRPFSLAELKLLVDSVQSSKFITQENTVSLIKKLESLATVYDAKLLQRQVYVQNRIKSMNESVYLNVDEISNAINRNCMIRFRYFEYTIGKERRLRHDGAAYDASPFALIWDNENYYLLAYDSAFQKIKHFRVDKMTDIKIIPMAREGMQEFAKLDMSSYGKRLFGMFNGTPENVRLRFANHLVGSVIDRFGSDIVIIRDGAKHFCVNVDVVVSPRFYAWVFGFGENAEIVSPPSVREGMKEHIQSVTGLYGMANENE